MRTRNKWYVVLSLALLVALAVSMAPLVKPAGSMRNGDTLNLTVFRVDKIDSFKAKISVDKKNRTVIATGEGGKPVLTIPNGKALFKRKVIQNGSTVCIHGYRDKGNNEPHEYIGHVTVVR